MKKHRMRYGFAMSVVTLVLMTIILCTRTFSLGGYEGTFQQSEVTELNELWTKTPDVSDTEDKDSYLVYSYTTTNEEPRHQVLAIESYWTMMEVYVGENKVFECKDDKRNRGMIVRWVDLPDDISGKTIRIRTNNDEKALDLKLLGTCCLGQKDAILFRMLLKNIYVVLFCIISFLAAVILLFTTLLFRKKMPDKFVASFTNLGLFILSFAVWIVADSRLLQFFTGYASMIALVYYLSTYLMPVFFLMFMKEMLSRHYPLLGALAFAHEGLLVVSLAIRQISGIPMYRLVYIEHAFVVVSIFFVIKYALQELQLYQKELMRTLVRGVFLFFVFTIISIIEFHLDHDSSYAIWFGIGMLIFIVFMWRVGVASLVYRFEMDRRVADYKRADEFDPLSGMKNLESFEAMRTKIDVPEELTYVMLVIENEAEYSEKDSWKLDQLILDTTECIRTIFEPRGMCFRLKEKVFLVALKHIKSVQVQECLQNVDAVIQNKNRHRREPIRIRYAYAQMPQECDEEMELYDLVEERVHI